MLVMMAMLDSSSSLTTPSIVPLSPKFDNDRSIHFRSIHASQSLSVRSKSGGIPTKRYIPYRSNHITIPENTQQPNPLINHNPHEDHAFQNQARNRHRFRAIDFGSDCDIIDRHHAKSDKT
jgi:hypothetical protein